MKGSLRLFLTALTTFALLTLSAGLPWSAAPVARAASVDELNRQKSLLDLKARQAELEANNQKSIADQAAAMAQAAASQADTLQQSIDSTEQDINSTQDQIGALDQQKAELESKLRQVGDQQDVLLRRLYEMMVSQPDQLQLFSDEPISKREESRAQFTALKNSLERVVAKTNAAKAEVDATRSQLVDKSNQLQQLKSQQEGERNDLADVQQQKQALADNAEAAVVQLRQQAAAARSQESQIENQISAAVAAALAAARARAASHASGATAPKGTGVRVHRGDLIGHEGSTGFSTGPHVHFEVRVNNVAVNPQPYIDNGTFTWPISNFVISQGFGYTSYAASGAYGGSIHTGIDLAGPYGEPVYAPANGTVILNQYYGGYGNAWAEETDSGIVALCGHMTGY